MHTEEILYDGKGFQPDKGSTCRYTSQVAQVAQGTVTWKDFAETGANQTGIRAILNVSVCYA